MNRWCIEEKSYGNEIYFFQTIIDSTKRERGGERVDLFLKIEFLNITYIIRLLLSKNCALFIEIEWIGNIILNVYLYYKYFHIC